MPNWLVWLVGRFDPVVRLSATFLGREERVSSDKAIRELGWTVRPAKETIIDAARRMTEHGLTKRSAKARAAAEPAASGTPGG